MQPRIGDRVFTAFAVVLASAFGVLWFAWPLMLLVYVLARNALGSTWAEVRLVALGVAEIGAWFCLLLVLGLTVASALGAGARWLGPARLEVLGRILAFACVFGGALLLLNTCGSPTECSDSRQITC